MEDILERMIGAAGELLILEGFQVPSVSHPHAPSRKEEDPANPHALENQQDLALLATQMGEESKGTGSEPKEQGAEPR